MLHISCCVITYHVTSHILHVMSHVISSHISCHYMSHIVAFYHIACHVMSHPPPLNRKASPTLPATHVDLAFYCTTCFRT